MNLHKQSLSDLQEILSYLENYQFLNKIVLKNNKKKVFESKISNENLISAFKNNDFEKFL